MQGVAVFLFERLTLKFHTKRQHRMNVLSNVLVQRMHSMLSTSKNISGGTNLRMQFFNKSMFSTVCTDGPIILAPFFVFLLLRLHTLISRELMWLTQSCSCQLCCCSISNQMLALPQSAVYSLCFSVWTSLTHKHFFGPKQSKMTYRSITFIYLKCKCCPGVLA